MKFPDKFICFSEDYATFEKFVPAPLFRKTFNVKSHKKSEMIISGLGFYRAFINGTEISKGPLAPYISNPDDIIYYDRYDVSELITDGKNVLSVILGNGFQNNPGGAIWKFDTAAWRSSPKLALRLTVQRENGEVKYIEADESFKTFESPIIFDDYRAGEYYDARLEIENWNKPGFDDSNWENACFTTSPKGEKRLCTAEPIAVKEEIKPVCVTETKDGFLYDFGVTNTGVCRLRIDGVEGQEITLHYGEWLENGKLNMENLRFPKQTELQKEFVQRSRYICKNGLQEHTPSFIYNSFRYVLVNGITKEQAKKELLTFVVFYSDLKTAGGFECSDDITNRLQTLSVRSASSCFVYFPNDCPHREKNGWTADAALSCEYTILNFNAEKSYEEWLRSICKAQNSEGALPGIIPTAGWGFAWGNGPAWDQVIVEIPYLLYRYYGNTEVLLECSDTIFKYIKYLYGRRDGDGLIAIGLGDWCAIRYNNSPISPLRFTDSVISAEIFRKAKLIFSVIGRNDREMLAKEYFNEMKKNVREKLINKQTLIAEGNCQTSQAMAIYYGYFEENEKSRAFENLLSMIKETEGHMAVGVLGARVLFHLLSEYGESDLAFSMITRTDFPSYGNWIKRGATTLWEGFHEEGGYVDSMNHHFWGDISAWFIKDIAGIKYNKDFIKSGMLEISPAFIEKLDYANAWHESPDGMISSGWKRENGNIKLKILHPSKLDVRIIIPRGWKIVSKQNKENEKQIICERY